MIYLATPYTHRDNFVMENRYREALECAADLIKQGKRVYSPIVHFHPMACIYGLPRDIEFWGTMAFDMIDRCDEFVVLLMEGWKESLGIAREVEYAAEQGKPISYLQWK